MRISIIVAASENGVIGRANSIPWHLPDDLKFFRKKTEGHPVIMGRKSFESIVAALGKPLPNRKNIIVTRESSYEAAGCKVASSLEEAIMYGHEDNDKEEIFIIGGGEIYRQAMDLCNCIYLTRLDAWIAGDITFPEVDLDVWEEVDKEEHSADNKHKFGFTFLTYKRKDRLHFED
jgi:dihydrofolate reductase